MILGQLRIWARQAKNTALVIKLQFISTESREVYGKANGITVQALTTLIGAVVNQFKGNLSPPINISESLQVKNIL